MSDLARALLSLKPKADPQRDFRVEDDGTGARITFWDVVKLGAQPSQAQIDAAVAALSSAPFFVAGIDFLDRFTDAEYLALLAAAGQNAVVARWIDQLRMDRQIDVNSKKAQAAKARMVQAGLLTQARADVVFAAS